MIRSIIALLLGCLLAGAAAAVEVGPILADKSKLVFVSKQMGVPVDGEFRKLALLRPAEPLAQAAAGGAR